MGNLKIIRAALLVAAAMAPMSAVAAQGARETSAMPRLHYTSRTLANGLQVYAIPDASSPSVSVQVW